MCTLLENVDSLVESVDNVSDYVVAISHDFILHNFGISQNLLQLSFVLFSSCEFEIHQSKSDAIDPLFRSTSAFNH